jgi:hypothetical protein
MKIYATLQQWYDLQQRQLSIMKFQDNQESRIAAICSNSNNTR